MAIKVEMDGAEYDKYLALQNKLKEAGSRYSIGGFELHDYTNSHITRTYHSFHIFSDSEVLRTMSEEIGRMKEVLRQADINQIKFYGELRALKDTDTKKKVLELADQYLKALREF